MRVTAHIGSARFVAVYLSLCCTVILRPICPGGRTSVCASSRANTLTNQIEPDGPEVGNPNQVGLNSAQRFPAHVHAAPLLSTLFGMGVPVQFTACLSSALIGCYVFCVVVLVFSLAQLLRHSEPQALGLEVNMPTPDCLISTNISVV